MNLQNWLIFDRIDIDRQFMSDIIEHVHSCSKINVMTYFDVTNDDSMINKINTDILTKKRMMSFRNYVIITCRPAVFRKYFDLNNIIDITGKTTDNVASNADWILNGFKSTPDGKIWFWSDTHFGHKNIIKYCNRPWNSGIDNDGNVMITDDDVCRMDQDLIDNYNSVVCQNDICYFLGDFCFGQNKRERIPEIVSRLNGKIRIVLGNHDNLPVDFYYSAGFDRVYDKPIIISDFIILSHEPLQFLNSNCPFYNCYGHVHDSLNYQTWTKNSCCACVERHSYRPVSLDHLQMKYVELNGCETE